MAEISKKITDGVLTILASGRIDSANADSTEKSITENLEGYDSKALIIDMENLDFVSSAGLRVILRLKKNYPDLKIINVKSDVYEVFDMTGFTEMINIEKAYRTMSVDGCEVIGRGAKGTVYRYNDDTIVKVYKSADCLNDILKERELARKAFVLGVPTAISYDVVRVGDTYGSVFELLDAKQYSELIAENPEKLDEYAKIYSDILKGVHDTDVNDEDMPDIKDRMFLRLNACKNYISEENFLKIKKLISDTPDCLKMIHGDYHTNNIMVQNGESILIDMDTLSHGHPVFELADVYITYVGFGETDPSNVENFLGVSYATAVKFWDKFVIEYLGTTDKEKINKFEEKVKLLCYVRLINHIAKRNADTDEGKKAIAYCVEKIDELINVVDTLEF